MMSEILEWLRGAVLGAIARGKVTAAQRGARNLLQIQLLSGETADHVEFMAPYGMSALPAAGADAVLLTVGATRDHKVIVAVDDPSKRIRDLAPGEFGLSDGSSMIVFRGGELQIMTSLPLNIQSSGAVKLQGTDIRIGDYAGTLQRLVDERFLTLFNNHVHADPQGGLTGAPTTTGVAGTHTTTITKAD